MTRTACGGNARTAALLALALALLAVVLLLTSGNDGARRPAAIPGSGEEQAANVAAEVVEAWDASSRRQVGDRSETANDGRAAEPPAPDATLPLTGVVVDANDRPIAGAEVVVSEELGAGFNMLAGSRRAERRGRQVTDRDGTFALAVPFARRLGLRVSADGFAPAWAEPCYAGEHQRVVLQQGASLEGRITDAATGDPVANVALEGWLADSGRFRVVDGESDADGSFRFEDLPPGTLVLDATPSEHENLLRQRVDLRAGETARLDLELLGGGAVFGTVTDAATGQPIAGAEISAGWTFEKVVRTDSAGHYRMQGAPGPGVSHMHARAGGYARASHEARIEGGADPEIRIDFELQRAGSVRGRVVDPAGAPLPGVYVAADADLGVQNGMGLTDWQHAHSGGDGMFRIRGLVPGAEYTLFLRHPGRATKAYQLPGRVDPDRELDAGDLVLGAPAVLLGRVVDQDGRGVPKAHVGLRGTNDDHDRLLEAGERGERTLPYHAANRDGRTDAEGRFRFADLAAGTYDLSVSVRGGPRGELEGVRVDGGMTTTGVEIAVDLGAVLAGVVVTEDGSPLPQHVSVQIDRMSGEGGTSRWVMPGRDGKFRALGLAEGHYRVSARVSRWANDEPAPWLGGELEDVAAGREDLRLVLYPADDITGRVVDGEGRPREGIVVIAVQTEADGHSARATTDAAGRFRVRARRGAVVDLRYGEAPPPKIPGYPDDPRPETAELYRGARAGATELVLELR